jgi:hypothetical protein
MSDETYTIVMKKSDASKGGIARSKKLTSERRSEIAKLAAKARWSKESRCQR